MESLEHKIGYTFQDRSLLQEALTHSSYANERHGRVRCNERMEFLGDAVLSIVSAELLYTRFPDMPEGQLSKLRSALVCTQSLAGFAAQIDLGSYLRMGKGEIHTKGWERPSTLENTFEALIAAIYLDGGMEPAKRHILRFLVPALENHTTAFKDYKTTPARGGTAEPGGKCNLCAGGRERPGPRQALSGAGAAQFQCDRLRCGSQQKGSGAGGGQRGAAPDGSMRKGNISILLPHHRLPVPVLFLRSAAPSAAKRRRPTPADVRAACEKAFEKDGFSYEIAFFGGSFTAIDPAYMQSLLAAAAPYVQAGKATGIRVSTRPDCVDDAVLALLKSYGVTAVELGCQSMDDRVLTRCRRGHMAADSIAAAQCVHRAGLELGVQMMTGLPDDTDDTALETAGQLIALRPATVRIYPTVVLAGTELERQYRSGNYVPQTVEQAVDLCSRLVPLFTAAGVRIIRLGLHSSPEVKEKMVAGAFHDSFGELVYSRMLLRRVLAYPPGAYTVTVHPRYYSRFVGNKNKIWMNWPQGSIKSGYKQIPPWRAK